MNPETEKYSKVVNILKKSKPVLNSTTDIEREVIKRISGSYRTDGGISGAIEFFFGWVYIGWVRRTLITASVLLVLVFIYQQNIILKQIKYLSSQATVATEDKLINTSDRIEKKMMLYKLGGRSLSSEEVTISSGQLEQLLESVNELQVQYKDLLKLIGEDPELKKLVEKKMEENSHKKSKL